ncbi:hypothetical protein GALMADRAFT_279474 [Galerina marginata CBS 339.88]|uniref:Uncharacterized protein n=1 Tax=Galerina marginata (strain CBS 339.88) TaxID=685588 RepID=A0A067T1Y5_GALM3|nr:hypothetical protein GALMADRAFT_279474 [Galerina marginata CBS 339.88]
MRNRPQHKSPSSSYSHSPRKIVDINFNELARRIGPGEPDKYPTLPQPTPTQPSYISLLPPEILTEIFTYCIPAEQFPIPSRVEAPLLLTQVSSHWRTLAISTPDLWAALHINYKDPTEDISAAEIWLSRSRNKPLSLSIAIDFGEQSQQGILDALCRHAKRWKHVRFDFRHLLCPPMYSLDLAQDSVPELATFEFHCRDISTANLSPVTRLLSSAPKLREVSWVDDLADTETLLQLPLNRLSRLSLAMEHGTLDYLQVLHECHNLEHIRIIKPALQTPQTRPPLSLSKLTSLNISSDLTGIFDHLILPALREVRIYSDSDKAQSHLPPSLPHVHLHSSLSSPPMEVWNPSAFLSLLDRSACAITSLSVTPPMTEDTLLMCLRQMSASLVKLSVKGVGVGDLLLGSLTRRSGRKHADSNGATEHEVEDEFLCPKLQEINFDTRVSSTQSMLADMVESRLPSRTNVIDDQFHDASCVPLRRIRIMDGHKDLEKLKELSQLPYHRAVWTDAFIVDVIPRKPARARPRTFFFRRKLCASR